MSELHYSILKYSPITPHTTPITLGILFHKPSLDHSEFRFTTDHSRLSKLTPAVDVEMVEKMLRGIREDIESERLGRKGFDIEDYTRFYLNDFSFGDIETLECDDLDEMIARIGQECL
jgi:hypothetical protein